MKKLILGLVAATAVAAAAPGLASADVSNNGTTNDAYGYCVANHIANFNGGHNGIGCSAPPRPASRSPALSGIRAPTDHSSTPRAIRPDQQQRLTYHSTCAPGSAEPGCASQRPLTLPGCGAVARTP